MSLLESVKKLGKKMTGTDIVDNDLVGAIEQIAEGYTGGGGGGGMMIVNIPSRWTTPRVADKTFAEIKAAIDDGVTVYANYDTGAVGTFRLPMIAADDNEIRFAGMVRYSTVGSYPYYYTRCCVVIKSDDTLVSDNEANDAVCQEPQITYTGGNNGSSYATWDDALMAQKATLVNSSGQTIVELVKSLTVFESGNTPGRAVFYGLLANEVYTVTFSSTGDITVSHYTLQ